MVVSGRNRLVAVSSVVMNLDHESLEFMFLCVFGCCVLMSFVWIRVSLESVKVMFVNLWQTYGKRVVFRHCLV